MLSICVGSLVLFPLASVTRYAIPSSRLLSYFLAAGLIVLGVVRGWSICFKLTNTGILVRNYFHSARIPWADVVRVHSDQMVGTVPFYITSAFATLCVDYRSTFIRSRALAGLHPKYASTIDVVRGKLRDAGIETDAVSITGQYAYIGWRHSHGESIVALLRRWARRDRA
jgi:hypothetical protein